MNKSNESEQWKLLVLLLREIAESKGISQVDISEIANIEQSTVSRMFGLKFTPTIATFLQVAKAINVNFFFEDQEGNSDLNLAFEKAMSELGRRTKGLPKN